MDTCVFRDNLIDDAGVFWYFEPDAASMIIRGNRNVLMNNVADGDVIIEGDGNTVSGLFFTRPEARLIVRGEGNTVLNVSPGQVLRD